MRYCYCLEKDLTQTCDLDIGGIDKIYFINANDFDYATEDTIYLNTQNAYFIDAAENLSNITQQTQTNHDQVYIQTTLSFTLRFNTTNLEEQLLCLTLGYFKALIRYRNGKWRLLDQDEYSYFKQSSVVHNSGTAVGDMNRYEFTYTLAGHHYGLLFDKKPTIVVNGESTDPKWEEQSYTCNQKQYLPSGVYGNDGFIDILLKDVNPNSESFGDERHTITEDSRCELPKTDASWSVINQECEQKQY